MICMLDVEVIEMVLGVKVRPEVKRPVSTDGCRPLMTWYTRLERYSDRKVGDKLEKEGERTLQSKLVGQI